MENKLHINVQYLMRQQAYNNRKPMTSNIIFEIYVYDMSNVSRLMKTNT